LTQTAVADRSDLTEQEPHQHGARGHQPDRVPVALTQQRHIGLRQVEALNDRPRVGLKARTCGRQPQPARVTHKKRAAG
jgi:hypothetical protein